MEELIDVVLYLVNGPDLVAQEMACWTLAAACGYRIVHVALERPGQISAWLDAQALVHAGEAVKVIMDSRRRIPVDVETSTMQIEVPPCSGKRPRRLR